MARLATKIKRFSVSLVVTTLIAICSPLAAKADLETDVYPYTIKTSDGRYVFVMLAGSPANLDSRDPLAKYPASGLYRNDGSYTPLWTVDWSAYVILPSDGVHLVRKGAGQGNPRDVRRRLLPSFRTAGR